MKSIILTTLTFFLSLRSIITNANLWGMEVEVYSSDDCQGTAFFSKTSTGLSFGECFSMASSKDHLPEDIYPYIEGLICNLGKCSISSSSTCIMNICNIICDSYNDTDCGEYFSHRYNYNSLDKTCISVDDSVIPLSYSFTFYGISYCFPPDPYCKNGIKGVGPSLSTICCTEYCGVCGGTGCSSRPGGSKDCCTESIFASDISCDITSAPCIVTAIHPSPPDPTCQNGIRNPDHPTICCARSCGVCGGKNCGKKPGGAKDCCTESILDSGISCESSSAPCIVTATPPSSPDPTCQHGIKGSGPDHSTICCTKSCGVCEGGNCGGRPGGTKDCCTENIFDSGISCKSSSAPCIISVSEWY